MTTKITQFFKKAYNNIYVFTGLLAFYICFTGYLCSYTFNISIFFNVFSNSLFYFIISCIFIYSILIIGSLFKHFKVYYLFIFWFFNVYTIINYYIVKFRGTMINIHDFTNINQIMEGKGNFEFTLNFILILVILIHITITFIIILYKPTEYKKFKICIVTPSLLLMFILFNIPMYKYAIKNYKLIFSTPEVRESEIIRNSVGPYLYFYYDALYNNLQKPDNYSIENATNIIDSYTEQKVEKEDTIIIAILNESWCNFNRINDFQTNIDVFKNYNNIDAYKGYVTISQIGGYTCNAEYEFLTGNSMYFLPNTSTAYSNYMIKNHDSIVSYLNKNNFKTTCISCSTPRVWNVNNVYKYFQFNQTYFYYDIIDYLNGNAKDYFTYTRYLTDNVVFNYLTNDIEKQNNSNLFYFVTTCQNHAPYDCYELKDFSLDNIHNSEEELYWRDIIGDKIDGLKYYNTIAKEYDTDTNVYENLIHNTDESFKYLVDYFKDSDKNVTIIMFGDHYPALYDTINKLYNKEDRTIDDTIKMYQTPFIIWNNKSNTNKFEDNISLNYLSNELFKVADIPLSKEQQQTEELRKSYPIICALGYKNINNEWIEKGVTNNIQVTDQSLLDYWIREYYLLIGD